MFAGPVSFSDEAGAEPAGGPRESAVLEITHRSSVTEDQIDDLGHMNVRYYGVNARAATDAVLGSWAGQPLSNLELDDIYTRHHREQLLGADLTVRSGVVGVSADGVEIYHELANAESGVLAATFVHRLHVPKGEAPLSAEVVAALETLVTPIPEQGATRSISLDGDPVEGAPTFAEVQNRGLAMRLVREVEADECHSDGRYRADMATMLVWAGVAPEGIRQSYLETGENGEKMGWAAMENRVRTLRLPRLGDRVQSFSALMEINDKTTRRRAWCYDADRGDLLTTFEVVNLAFNIDARKPMSIPTASREREAQRLHPDLDV